MDAMLWELLAAGAPDEQVEVLIRLTELGQFPNYPIEIVAQIGNVLSCKIRRGDIEVIRQDASVWSMKASRKLTLEPPIYESVAGKAASASPGRYDRRPPGLPYTGKGVAIGIADWGIDFTHGNFLNPDGTSRLMALWDQGADYDGNNSYGFGTIFYKEEIDQALVSANPFQTLNYFPGEQDLYNEGMHGTHVMDIAAGNGSVGPLGLAPEADLIAVHISDGSKKDLIGLGSSARVFDAIHFLHRTAGDRPLVINLSMGGQGDAHEGRSLIEQAIDQLIISRPGRAVVQSCGNYYSNHTHTEGYLDKDNEKRISWIIPESATNSSEIEIWYDPLSLVSVTLVSPSGAPVLIEAGLGKEKIFGTGNAELGRYYHREKEPNTQLNQVEIILDGTAPRGVWQVLLRTVTPLSIRYQAWIERSDGGGSAQSHFTAAESDPKTTTGSICNGVNNITVGAIGERGDRIQIGSFSSVGPTWDGRQKPDLTAPGIQVIAAKSAAFFENRSSNALTSKTGTSMAAPYVTGAVALIYESAGRPVSIAEVKDKLFSTCDPVRERNDYPNRRFGAGSLNIEKLFGSALAQRAAVSVFQKKKEVIMSKVNYANAPVESLLQIAQDQTPELNENGLLDFFDSLPGHPDDADTSDIQRGDVLIRRQYAHRTRIWFGIVEFVYEKDIFLFSPNGKRKICGPLSKWEWKRIRPDYQDVPDTPSALQNGSWASPYHLVKKQDENISEAVYAEDADSATANLATVRKGASKNAVSKIFQRVSSATCLKHPSLPNNPLIGVTEEMIRACYNAHHMHGAISKPEILMAFWKKEGSDQQQKIRDFGTTGISAGSAENAISIFRSTTYYLEMGMDVLIDYTAVPGSDNVAQIDETTAKDHEAAFAKKIGELVKQKFLGRNLVKDINANLTVKKVSKDVYTVSPTTHFYIFNLLVMDALLRFHEDQISKIPGNGGVADIGLTYMHWNMREKSFTDFIKSANSHRKEAKYLKNGSPISLVEWAFERCPEIKEFGQSRTNAIKVRYFVEVFALLFVDPASSGSEKEEYAPDHLPERFSEDYEEAEHIRRGEKSDSARLTWNASPATVQRLDRASSPQPGNRVYYLVSGAAGNKGAYIEIDIENANAHYNLKGIYFALILQWAKNNGGQPIADASTVIKAPNQKLDWKFFDSSSGDEIENGGRKKVRLNIRPEDLANAYKKMDKSNSLIYFEVFCYWHDGNLSYNYYWNSIKNHFFLVQPLEMVDNGEILDIDFGHDFQDIRFVKAIVKGRKEPVTIPYPALYNTYEHPITLLKGVTEQSTVTVGIVDISSDSITSTMKDTQTKGNEQTLKFNIGAEFVEGGSKSILGLGYENKVSQSNSREISESLAHTDTYQKSLTVSNTLTFAPGDEAKQYFAKLVFAPVLVNAYRYSGVDENGVANKRELLGTPILIWRPAVWAKYPKVSSPTPKRKDPPQKRTRDLTRTEDWEEVYHSPAEINKYKPSDESSLIIDRQEFSSGISGFFNFKNPSVPHNTIPKSVRQASDIKFIVLHETSGFPRGAGFNKPTCEEWTETEPKTCLKYDDTTAHLAVLMRKNPTAGQPDVPVIHQFNDLSEIEYHASIFNKTAFGIEFGNRDWQEGHGIKKNNIPERLAEDKGYIHLYWGDGYNIYKFPLLDQLEKLVDLVLMLTRKVIDGFPMIDRVWLQVVSYNDVRDYFDFNETDIPEEASDKEKKSFFIYTNATDYMVPGTFSGRTGILSHGSVSNINSARYMLKNAHTDGSFQALYTWLRIDRNLTATDAFSRATELLRHNHVVVKTKTKVHWYDNGEKTGRRNIHLLNISTF